jgi:hypothetical protein
MFGVRVNYYECNHDILRQGRLLNLLQLISKSSPSSAYRLWIDCQNLVFRQTNTTRVSATSVHLLTGERVLTPSAPCFT